MQCESFIKVLVLFIRIFIGAVFLVTSVNSFDIYCESIENCWSSTYCCFLNNQAAIESKDTTIGNKDKSVTEVHFTLNTKIQFLPASIHQSFPNLRFYAAGQCGLEQVFKNNFELLPDLAEIILSENRIHTITSDTFEGLRKLEVVVLCELLLQK